MNGLASVVHATFFGSQDPVAAIGLPGQVVSRDPRVVRQDLLLLTHSLIDDFPTLLRRLSDHSIDVSIQPLDARVLGAWACHRVIEMPLYLRRHHRWSIRIARGTLLRLGAVS